jgi:hypothetical protein
LTESCFLLRSEHDIFLWSHSAQCPKSISDIETGHTQNSVSELVSCYLSSICHKVRSENRELEYDTGSWKWNDRAVTNIIIVRTINHRSV